MGKAKIVHLALALTLVAGLVFGSYFIKKYIVKKELVRAVPPQVVLKNRPAWMSEFLANSITAPIRPEVAKSPFDHKVLVDAVVALKMNPWIREIHSVRRVFENSPGDTIEVDCEYRTPVALVKSGGTYTLVDSEGVILPEQFSENEISRIVYGADGKMNIRVIEGVAQKVTSPGKVWQGGDLQAGLEMVRLLCGYDFAEDILKVNVANFQGRKDLREAQIVLGTRFTPATEIRWGRGATASDAFIEVSAAQKLKYMQNIYLQYKRVDAGQRWLDLRFDHVLYPEAQISASN